MIPSLLISLSLNCAPTVVKNLSKEPIRKIDLENQAVATKRCGEVYVDAPCLVQFIKVEKQVYRAVCGRAK